MIIESRLSADMQSISNWCSNNEVILNLKKGKTELMMFGTAKNLSSQPIALDVKYNNQTVHVTSLYKYLGILLTPSLNLNLQFEKKMKTSNSRLRLLQKVRPYLTTLSAKTLYQTMIRPIISYGSLVNLNLTETQRSRMNRFHNRAVDVILYRDTKIDRNDIVSPIQSISIKA